MEYKVSYLLGPSDDQELGTFPAIHAEDDMQAAFAAGYRLRQESDGRPARLLSVVKTPAPCTVYFKGTGPGSSINQQAHLARKRRQEPRDEDYDM
jgi:hypothetical protein